MFRALAALALASASTQSPTTLNPTAAWWERVTVLVAGNGEPQSCRYESSLQPGGGQDCSVTASASATAKSAGAEDQYTRLTFERRFSPGARPDIQQLQPGETLLGGRLMSLAIDAKGAVKNCQVLETSGSVTPQYSCADLEAERFTASVGGEQANATPRAGYMSIIVYGHSEHVV